MADDLVCKIGAFGGRLKINSAEVGRKVISRMSSKMKGFFQGQSQEDKVIEEATSETLEEPDWAANLEVCDMVNAENINQVIRSIKKRIGMRNSRVQYLALVLLDTCVKNCEKAFAEVAAEGVHDEMVRLIDDPQTMMNNRKKALGMIEAWGGSGKELRCMPVCEDTNKGLKSRGIQFPRLNNENSTPILTPLCPVFESAPDAEFCKQTRQEIPVQRFTAKQTNEAFDVARDSIELLSTVLSSSQQDALKDTLTTTLVHQCHECQLTIHKIIETALGGGSDGESVFFEALNLSDSLQKILTRYEQSRFCPAAQMQTSPMILPVAPEQTDLHLRLDDQHMMDELDKIIFGNEEWSSADVHSKPRNSNSNCHILTVT